MKTLLLNLLNTLRGIKRVGTHEEIVQGLSTTLQKLNQRIELDEQILQANDKAMARLQESTQKTTASREKSRKVRTNIASLLGEEVEAK